MHDEPIITRAPYKDVEIGRGGYDVPDTLEYLDVDRTAIDELLKLRWYERLSLAVDDVMFKVKLSVLLVPGVFLITKGLAMRSWKTTITGVVGALAVLVNSLFGLNIPSEAIIAVTLFILGFFAKDSDVSGGTVQQ